MMSDILVNIGSGNDLAPTWRQAITWTNIDLSSVRSSDNHVMTNLQGIAQSSINNISLKIT